MKERKPSKFIISFFIFLIVPTFFYSQKTQILSTAQGLPQSFVTGIVQDESGFLWISTRNGIGKYDGINFTVFQHDFSDKNSIADNLIISLKYFNNSVWIEYESGNLDKLDPKTEKITHFKLHSEFDKAKTKLFKHAWFVDDKETIWMLTENNSLVSYSSKTGKLKWNFQKNDSQRLLLQGITGNSSYIWILSRNQLICYNKKTQKIKEINLDANKKQRFKISYIDLFLNNDGYLIWGNNNNLNLFSTKKFQIKTIHLPLTDKNQMFFISKGNNGNIYFENSGKVFELTQKHNVSLIDNSLNLYNTTARSFFVDDSGLIWIGTNAKGLLKVDLKRPIFPSYKPSTDFPNALLEKELGSTIQNLFAWTDQDTSFSLPGYHFRSFYDQKGNLWMGMKQTIICFNPKTRKIIKLPVADGIKDKNQDGIGLKGIAVNSSGTPYIIGYNGNIYFFENKRWNLFLSDHFLKKKFGQAFVPNNLYIDNDKLWITTEGHGLIYIDLRTKLIHQLNPFVKSEISEYPQLLSIISDPINKNIFWIGSYQGLIKFNKVNLTFQVFTIKQGLPDNTIYSVEKDLQGNLWFSTNKGLCRFNTKNNEIKIFQSEYGIPGDEFNRFHSLRLPDGRLSYGGTEGWTIINPNVIKDDYFQPKLSFTGFKVNNFEISPKDGNGILQFPINATKELNLKHNQNSFSFYFAGMEFSQPKDLKYRYKLYGYDKNWVQAGKFPVATYTQVPPGNYQFIVNCSNNSGVWSKNTRIIRINIETPWWKTWWAFMLYLLMTFGVVLYWLRLKQTKMKLQHSFMLKQKEAKQIEELIKMKEQFFNNIGHDFRTPLTLILSPAHKLLNELSGTSYEKDLSYIQNNAEQLISLINQWLDFSKIDEGMMKINQSLGDLEDFTKKIVQFFQSEADEKEIKIILHSEVSGLYFFDHEKLNRILTNLLSNALKFTDKKVNIQINIFENEKNNVVFIIKDNGCGIPEKDLPYIFDRYYQSENKKSYRGTGIGLSLVKELVKIQNGTINVQSNEDIGTIFTLFLPYHNAKFSNDMRDVINDMAHDQEQIGEEKPVVLLIEDHYEMAQFIISTFSEFYEIIYAANGEQGLITALEKIPDIIIADIMMPHMDGLTFCRKIKNNENTSHIPLILLTAKTGVENEIEGLASGADDYLEKPFHPQELLLRVENILNRQNQVKQYLIAHKQKEDAEDPAFIDPFIIKLYQSIEVNLDNSSLGVEEFAGIMSISRVQLHRKIKAISGLTASELIRNYRLEKAASFLKQGYNSSEAAYKSGFESPAYFSKCFKTYFGKTPSEFLK